MPHSTISYSHLIALNSIFEDKRIVSIHFFASTGDILEDQFILIDCLHDVISSKYRCFSLNTYLDHDLVSLKLCCLSQPLWWMMIAATN